MDAMTSGLTIQMPNPIKVLLTGGTSHAVFQRDTDNEPWQRAPEGPPRMFTVSKLQNKVDWCCCCCVPVTCTFDHPSHWHASPDYDPSEGWQ